MRTALPLALLAALLVALAILSGCPPFEFSTWVAVISIGAVVAGAVLALTVGARAREIRVPGGIPVLLGLAVVLRLLVLPSPFTLTEDAARYHWDGKVLAHGISPWAYPPNAPELASLPDHAIDARISSVSRENLAVYPPLAYSYRDGNLDAREYEWTALGTFKDANANEDGSVDIVEFMNIGAKSYAQADTNALVREAAAPFVTTYEAMSPHPPFSVIEPILTMAPPPRSRMLRAANWATRKYAR